MGRREEMVKLAEELMDKPQNIRNIGIVAHIDHGKCVTADTRISLKDGQNPQAESLFNQIADTGKSVKENKNERVFEAKNCPLAFSYNKETRKLEPQRITHAWKLKTEQTVRLTLSNGVKIETTPEHRYLILTKEGRVEEKRADALATNDFVLTMQKGCSLFVPSKAANLVNNARGASQTTTQQLTQYTLHQDCGCYRIQEIRKINKPQTVYDFTVENNHNFVGNTVVIHNTTMTDSLIAAAGLISQELAGRQLFMDSYDLEQQRGITINAANISIVYPFQEKEHLINVIDTPGHVDFGGDVIRAMRAVDGVVVLVDAVEGVMPQTETVIRQALREYCRPVLFINKVDRLVNELKVSPGEMQERLVKTIAGVNRLIEKNAPEQFREKWKVSVENGTVCLGSGLYKWALSLPRMKETGISFADVYKYCKDEQQPELSKKSPLYAAILEMVIIHLPSPVEAQKYRVPEIWKGDLQGKVGKGMLGCDPDAPLAMMVTKVQVDPHSGEITAGRVYGGTVRRGQKLRLIGLQKDIAIQQVGVYMGPERVNVEHIPAGNIAAIVGVKEAFAGETLASEEIEAFESFKTTSQPVMTVSIEAKQTKDLPKLIEVVRQISKEDPNVVAAINQDTGEHLISGMGELHLEVTQHRIEVDHKIPIEVGDPIVVYHEAIQKPSPDFAGKSPNKHNLLKLKVEPISKDMLDKLIEEGMEGKIRKKDKHLVEKLKEIGFSTEDARKAWWVHNNCVLIDNTRGIVALQEIRELVCQGFVDAMNEGPLGKEKCHGVIVRLLDAKLHEDAIHRGPAQMLPVVTRTIYACMLSSDPVFLEPMQKLFISVPQDVMGAVSGELQQRRATIDSMETAGDTTTIIAIAPVKELIGFSSAIRSATAGRVIWTAEFHDFAVLPHHLREETIAGVRTRKGMDPEPKSAQYFLD